MIADGTLPSLKLLMPSTQFGGLGGVEAILRGHHQHDARFGIDSRFIAFWEAEHPGFPRARFLNFREDMTIREARRRVRTAFPDFQPDLVVYHTVWGWPYFADLHGPCRKILYLHSDTPGLDRQLETRVWWADGFACVNDRITERVRSARPDLSAQRILRVDYPIEPPADPPSPARPFSKPFVIGYCGRIANEQKRIDRLPEVFAKLDTLGVAYRMEFLGDGPERGWLENALPDRDRFKFHGRKSGADYWRVFSEWDAVIFVSDYEGTPIALLEAMAAGVIPIHPMIGSGGDQYAAHVHPKLAYPAWDSDVLAGTVHWLDSLPQAEVESLRRRSIEAVSGHGADRYRKRFAEFARAISTLPPLEKRPLPRRPFPMDWLSFSATRTLMDAKRRLFGR